MDRVHVTGGGGTDAGGQHGIGHDAAAYGPERGARRLGQDGGQVETTLALGVVGMFWGAPATEFWGQAGRRAPAYGMYFILM